MKASLPRRGCTLVGLRAGRDLRDWQFLIVGRRRPFNPANGGAPTRQVNVVLAPGGYLGRWCRANGAMASLAQLYRSAYPVEVGVLGVWQATLSYRSAGGRERAEGGGRSGLRLQPGHVPVVRRAVLDAEVPVILVPTSSA